MPKSLNCFHLSRILGLWLRWLIILFLDNYLNAIDLSIPLFDWSWVWGFMHCTSIFDFLLSVRISTWFACNCFWVLCVRHCEHVILFFFKNIFDYLSKICICPSLAEDLSVKLVLKLVNHILNKKEWNPSISSGCILWFDYEVVDRLKFPAFSWFLFSLPVF